MGFLGKLALAMGFGPEAQPAPASWPPPFQPTAWHRIGYRYNPGRLTREQMRSLSEELFAAGLIGFPDRRLLSLDEDTLCANWPNWSAFETLGERGGRRDWIGEIGARIAKGHPDPLYGNYLDRLLALLRRLDAARKEAEQHWGPPPDAISVPALIEPSCGTAQTAAAAPSRHASPATHRA